MPIFSDNVQIYESEISNTQSPTKSCWNHPICWSDPPQSHPIVEYLHGTYLHGLKFVGQVGRHLVERIFWILAFTAGMVFAIYLILDVWRKYKTSPVILAFDPNIISISDFQFPSVTICNVNKVQKSYAEKILAKIDDDPSLEDEQDYYLLHSICSSKPTFAKKLPEAKKFNFQSSKMKAPENGSSKNYIADFLQKAGQPCSEMIRRCYWSDEPMDCREIFFPVITELGICCTFNMVPPSLLYKFPSTFEAKNPSEVETSYKVKEHDEWDNSLHTEVEEHRKLPRKQYHAGLSHGLSILLYPDTENHYCAASDSSGFRVALHSAYETPHVTEFGIAVPPGADVYLDVFPELTVAEEIISRFKVSDRHCYFEKEYKLKYFHHYTQLNCLDECLADLHKKNCNCTWFYEPRDNLTTVCKPDRNSTQCATLKDKLSNDGVRKQYCSHCLPLCNQIRFRIQSSLSELFNSTVLWKNLSEIISDPNTTESGIWIEKSTTILNIYYGDSSFVPKQRKELYGPTDLIASTGGLLGLCLGFSGLSALELIYFCTIRYWLRRKRYRSLCGHIRRNFKKFFRKGTIQSSTRSINIQKNQVKIWSPFPNTSNGKINRSRGEMNNHGNQNRMTLPVLFQSEVYPSGIGSISNKPNQF